MEITIGCPIVTPFDGDGRLDTDALADLVDRLVSEGIDLLVPCGTTGEVTALTDSERRSVIETTVSAAADRATVMAGVGGTAVATVRERIRHAADAGADSALVVAPYFGGQPAPEGNERFFAAVADDIDLPLFLYNIPPATGQQIAPETVDSLARRGLYEGIKDSSGDLTYLDELIDRTPAAFDVFQGWDAQYVPALAMGTDGAINAVTHLAPERFAAAAAAVASGEMAAARGHQFDGIDPAAHACLDHGFAPAVKAVLAERGVLATDTVRPPLVGLDEKDRRQLIEALDG